MKKDFLAQAEKIKESLKRHASFLADNPEIGFELQNTKSYVMECLRQIGIEPVEYGKCGVGGSIKGKGGGRTVLLRADMDALDISSEDGSVKRMHACGHHFHTAMLLGCAEILKKSNDFCGEVRLMFQGAEEILSGAKDMIESGILDTPRPEAAMMIHVMTGVDMPVGSVVVSSEGVSAPAADFFKITVSGKGAHGALSHQGIDALSASAYILISLHEIKAREISIDTRAGLTVGRIVGGKSANALPESVLLEGSLRAFDEETRDLLGLRVRQVSENIATAFRASAAVEFTSGCPTLINDERISNICALALKEELGGETVHLSSEFKEKISGGSEDFAYVTHEIPSVMIAVCAGSTKDGYKYPLHNACVSFDDRALSVGAAAYCAFAVAFLREKD